MIACVPGGEWRNATSAIAAPALPTARTSRRPSGGGGRCEGKHRAADTADRATSNISRASAIRASFSPSLSFNACSLPTTHMGLQSGNGSCNFQLTEHRQFRLSEQDRWPNPICRACPSCRRIGLHPVTVGIALRHAPTARHRRGGHDRSGDVSEPVSMASASSSRRGTCRVLVDQQPCCGFLSRFLLYW